MIFNLFKSNTSSKLQDFNDQVKQKVQKSSEDKKQEVDSCEVTLIKAKIAAFSQGPVVK